jgi:hypothetical protein
MQDQATTNQKAIDLIYEYCDSSHQNFYVDPKELLKYLRNRGFEVHQVGDGQKDYQTYEPEKYIRNIFPIFK